jgi:hypothetical protein
VTHSIPLAVWLSIVSVLAVFAGIVIPLTAWQRADNHRRLRDLMDTHERNLRSGDPVTAAESRQRWQETCRRLQHGRHALLWRDLERWGESLAKEILG